VRVGPAGTVLAQRSWGGVDDDEVRAAARLAGGRVRLAGRTRSLGAGGSDAWLVDLAPDLTEHAQRRFGGAGDEEVLAIAARGTEGSLLLATTTSFGAGDEDLFLLALDAAAGTGASCPLAGPASLASAPTTALGMPGVAASVGVSAGDESTTAGTSDPALGATIACAVTPGEVSPPGGPEPLRFVDRGELRWEPAAGSCSTTFSVYRDAFFAFGSPALGQCWAANLTTSLALEPDTPAAGEGWLYLVAGRANGIEGPTGHPGPAVPCP
jgi:hypothetical protein